MRDGIDLESRYSHNFSDENESSISNEDNESHHPNIFTQLHQECINMRNFKAATTFIVLSCALTSSGIKLTRYNHVDYLSFMMLISTAMGNCSTNKIAIITNLSMVTLSLCNVFLPSYVENFSSAILNFMNNPIDLSSDNNLYR